MLSVSHRHSRMKIILALLLFVCVTRCHGDESDYARPVSKCGPASPDPRSAVLCNFLLIAPRFMTMGTTQQVCMDFVRDSRVHLPAMNINILLKLSTNISESDVIASTQLHNQHVNGASLCADLELPDGEDYVYEQSAYLMFTAEESTFFHIADHKPVNLLRDIVKLFTFIEPDKPVYKPGQTVKFRILTLTKDLRPVAERIPKVWIDDPSGTRMQQWLSAETDEGLAGMEFELSNQPPLGVWKIVVQTHSGKTSKSFEVQEYVLPKYEVTVTPSSRTVMRGAKSVSGIVCAKYTYGKPVEGNAVLQVCARPQPRPSWSREPELPPFCKDTELTLKDGCRKFDVDISDWPLRNHNYSHGTWRTVTLSLSANVTEDDTDVMLSGETEVKVSKNQLFLKFLSKDEFKPFLTYNAEVSATSLNGQPAAGVRIRLTVTFSETDQLVKTVVTGSDGVARLPIDLQLVKKQLSLKADSLDHDAVDYIRDSPEQRYSKIMLTKPHATIYLSSWISASSHYLQIESDVNTLRCREKGEVRVRYTVDGPGSRQFYYKIVVSNHIVDVGSTEQQLTEEEYQQLPSTDLAKPVASFNLQFDVTPEMAPLLHVLVYHVVNYNGTKEVIADTKKINVEKCFPQKVTMRFAAQQQLPGAAEKLTIRGSPNSLCAVGVVDKSVTLLGASTSITADKIFAKVIPATNRRRSYIRAWEYCASKYGPPNGPEEIPPPPIPGLQGPPGPPGPVAFPAIVEPVIRTSRHSLYWTFTNNVDSRLAFQNLGLTVMSDMEVDARPCVSRERRWRYYMRTGNKKRNRAGSRGPGSAGGIQPMPMAAPGPEVVTMEVDYDNDGGPEESSTTAAEQDIRTYFPETWLWDLYRLDHSGQVDVHTEVPDTITDWVGGGYCTSVDAGFGVSPPLSLRAFQPFFISYTLPYSAVRNERIPLIVSVFNYLSDSLTIELTLEDSDAFEVFSDKQVALCASGGTATTHRYMIRPQLLGEVNVTVHALSLPTTNLICGNEVAMSETGAGVRDAITQRLLVEAEGVEKAYSVSMFACPHRESGGVFTDVMDLALPSEDLVPDSGRATVSVIGDVMGSALQNLDALLTMPYGCGEQNMITFAPDIYIMQYLTATGQATDAISKKALTYMRAGYQRELTYRHDDGAYSAFGNRDKEGSMWLTAFVVRSFAEARPFIFIDDAQIAASVEWIARRQGEDGCFPVVGTLHHKGMKGGVGDARTKATLTAYVATSLIAATMPAVQEPIAAALSCIERESFSDAYTLALVAYMYARHGDSARSGEYLARLMDLAIEDTSLKTLHWEKPNAEVVDTSLHWNRQAEKKAINTEMTAYALLTMTLLTDGGDLTRQLSIMRWLTQQQDSRGAFASTQDTVIGLQALSQFASLSHGSGGVRTDVTIAEGGATDAVVHVTNDNSLVLQQIDVAAVPARVEVTATGSRCAIIQGNVFYNVFVEKRRVVTFQATIASRPQGAECKAWTINACGIYSGEEDSNMAVISIKMVSGFSPIKATLKKIFEKLDPNSPLKRYEVNGKSVDIYVNKFTPGEPICVTFDIEKYLDVEDAKPSTVRVYDYYEPEEAVSILYNIGECN